jgi:hypothetical protein
MTPPPTEFEPLPRNARASLGAALILLGALGVALLQVVGGTRAECREAACASPVVQSALRSF